MPRAAYSPAEYGRMTPTRDLHAPHSQPHPDERRRIRLILQNFWLHVHPVRVRREHMKPSHTWYLGFISVYLYLITLVTGVALMVYYRPHPAQAYQDMKDLHYVVFLGRFMRNAHRWAAEGMIVAVVLHMLRVFLSAAYRESRKLNW